MTIVLTMTLRPLGTLWTLLIGKRWPTTIYTARIDQHPRLGFFPDLVPLLPLRHPLSSWVSTVYNACQTSVCDGTILILRFFEVLVTEICMIVPLRLIKF